MNRPPIGTRTGIMAGVVILAVLLRFPPAAQAQYMLNGLGTFGGLSAVANGINDSGQIIATQTGL